MPRYFLPYQQAIAQRVLDDPFFLGVNLVEMWIPTDNYLTNVSGACSSWRGVKQGITWTQSTAGNRPLISTFRGTPCLSFNGTSHTMSLPPWEFDITNNVPGFTIATVHAWSAAPTVNRIIFISQSGGDARISSYGGRTSGLEGSAFKRLDSDSESIQGSQGSIIANRLTVKIVSANYAANTNFTSNNGTIFTGVPSSSGPGNTSATSSSRIELGSYQANVAFFQGPIMMVVAVRAALSLQEAERLGGIMAWMTNSQSSLIGSHPYANNPPLIGG